MTGSNLVIPYTSRGTNRFGNLTGEVLAHADPGTTVYATQVGDDFAVINIHGYYVDVP